MNALLQRAKSMIAGARSQVKLAHAYQQVFDTPAGDMVQKDILRFCGVLEVDHVPGDPYTTAFNSGKRAAALHIIDRMRWSEAELVALARATTAQTIAATEEESL